MIMNPDNDEFGEDWAYGKAFIKRHQQEFGFTLPDRDIIVDDVRVRGIGKTFEGLERTVDRQLKEINPKDVTPDKIHTKSKVYFEAKQRREETPIYKLEGLDVGDRIKGPAIIADGTQTIVVTPGATALIIETHVVITVGEACSDVGYASFLKFFRAKENLSAANVKIALIQMPKKLTLSCLVSSPTDLWLLVRDPYSSAVRVVLINPAVVVIHAVA